MLQAEGIIVHKFAGLSDLSRPLLPELYKMIMRSHYDIVHVYGMQKGFKLWPLRLTSGGARPKTIVNLNSVLLAGSSSQKVRNVLAYHILLDHACDKIITVSNCLAESLIDQYGLPKSKVSVVTNGIPLDWFDQMANRAPSPGVERILEGLSGCPKICQVGYLLPLKGHTFLLRAAKLVVEQVHDAHFLIVGDGPSIDSLKQYSENLGIAEKVHFVGKLNYDAIPWLLSRIDIGVSTSLLEQFPKNLLELGAAGKPVVATDVGDSKEIVEDGVSGYVVRPRDVETTANCILALLEDPRKARSMGIEGRHRIEKEFSISGMVQKISFQYQSLL